MAKAITYYPKSQMIVKGAHEGAMNPNMNFLAASDTTLQTREETLSGNVKQLVASYQTKTNLHNYSLQQLAASISQNKLKIRTGQLTAADYEAQRDNLDHLILIRLHQQLMGEQERWFYLDEMFNTLTLDTLLYRMSFQNNPAATQEVGPREEYDTAKVEYDEISFSLTKKVTSWDIPIEDPLRALINPITPLQKNNEWSNLYYRENDALKALQAIGNHYTKDATGAGKFTATSAPTDNATKRISNPSDLASGNVHSDNKTVNELQDLRNAFLKQYDMDLTHWACSPKTAMAIAQNTWTQNNTIFNVEAYRTRGGVRSFPGLADATMVISIACPDNVLYAVNKPFGALWKAEGPKITKSWEDNTRWTQQTAKADFFQYKCAHEDLTLNRKFGVIVDLES